MREGTKIVGIVFIFIIGLIGLGWLLAMNNVAMMRFFWPQHEAIRRDTMIESRAYSEATLRRLYDLKRQYIQAKTDEEKEAIRLMAQHEADAFDKSRLPTDLKLFVK